MNNQVIEKHSEQYADQYLGCIECKVSHHDSAYCSCGECFFVGSIEHDPEYGTFVKCFGCGKVSWWD